MPGHRSRHARAAMLILTLRGSAPHVPDPGAAYRAVASAQRLAANTADPVTMDLTGTTPGRIYHGYTPTPYPPVELGFFPEGVSPGVGVGVKAWPRLPARTTPGIIP